MSSKRTWRRNLARIRERPSFVAASDALQRIVAAADRIRSSLVGGVLFWMFRRFLPAQRRYDEECRRALLAMTDYALELEEELARAQSDLKTASNNIASLERMKTRYHKRRRYEHDRVVNPNAKREFN